MFECVCVRVSDMSLLLSLPWTYQHELAPELGHPAPVRVLHMPVCMEEEESG